MSVFRISLYLMLLCGPGLAMASASCPDRESPLRQIWSQAESHPEPLLSGRYQLKQAQVTFAIPSSSSLVEVQYLETPGSGVTAVILCPDAGNISDTGPNLKVITESVLEAVEVVDQKVLLIDGSQLWDLVILAIDDEIHPQSVRKSPLALATEGLQRDALMNVSDLQIRSHGELLLILYQNVILLYGKL